MPDLIEQLKKRDGNTVHKNFYLGNSQFYIDDEGRKFAVDDNVYSLDETAFHQLCEVLNVPFIYAKRCPQELQETTINSWLNFRKNNMWAALFEGEGVRSFMNPTYSWVPSSKVYDTVVKVIGDHEISSSEVDDEAVEFIAFTPALNTKVINSDVQAGIKVLYSDSWNIFPRFESYVCRMACMNAAIAPLAQRKFRVSGNSPEEIEAQVAEFVRESLNQLPAMLNGFEALVEHDVDNPVAVVTRICVENKLPNKIRELVLRSMGDPEYILTVPDQKVTTMHDIVNLFTFVASHKELSDEHRQSLFEIAGSIMLHDKARCSTCGSTSV